MNHDEAIKTYAADGYLLGDLSPEERDAFEMHFFECDECALSVREAEVVADGTRALNVRTFRPRKLIWLMPVAAALVIGVGLGRVRPHEALEYDRPLHSIAVRGTVRGAPASEQTLPANTAGNYIKAVIAPSENAVEYIATIRDARGARCQWWKLSPKEMIDPVSLPLRPLPPGGYELVIEGADRGGTRTPIVRATFNVVRSAR